VRLSVCLCVCLCVCMQTISNNNEQILITFCRELKHGPGRNCLDFGGFRILPLDYLTWLCGVGDI